jgi:AAA+ ATPase superfamily predicted ATPase
MESVAFAILSETLRAVCQDLEFRSVSANPFAPFSGKVDRPELFFNRQQELEEVFKILNAGSSVSLVGERAVGKSSILSAVYREAEVRLRHRRRPLYLDMAAVQDDNDFYEDFCRQAGIPVSRGVRLQRRLKGLRMLLILDELEMMTWKGFTLPLRSQLRSFANGGHETPLKLVMASITPLESLFPEKAGEPSPFYNICERVDVRPWSDETARQFIASRLDLVCVNDFGTTLARI